MRLQTLLIILFSTIFLACCATREQVQEGLYEGLTKRQQIIDPSPDPIPKGYPSYHEYQGEREDILKKEGEETTPPPGQ